MCLLDFPCCTLGTFHVQIPVSRCLGSLASPSRVSFICLPYSRSSALPACAIPFQEPPGQCESHSSFCWTIPHCLPCVALEGSAWLQKGLLTSGRYLHNQLILILVFHWFLCLCSLRNCNLSIFFFNIFFLVAPFPLEGEASGGNTQSQSPRLGQEGDIGQSCGDQAAGHVQPAGTCTTDAKTLKQIYRGLPFQLQWFGCTKGNFEAGNCNYIYIYIYKMNRRNGMST